MTKVFYDNLMTRYSSKKEQVSRRENIGTINFKLQVSNALVLLREYPMIGLGITAHKLRNFSISWNTSAQRALSLDRIGTGSNLIERQLRWLKGQHKCRLCTRRNEDSGLQLFTEHISRPNEETGTKTHLSKHFENLVIFPIKNRRRTAKRRRVYFGKIFWKRLTL